MDSTGIDPRQLLACVIQPVLGLLALPSERNASANLLGIAAQESTFRFLMQTPTGPARSPWQMEGATHDDLFANYLAYQPKLKALVDSLAVPGMSRIGQLAGNMLYACACARVQLYRAPEALPAYTDVPGMARLWKKRWNTPQGAGTEAQFVANWNRFGLSAVIGP